jgi:hypothetical protein
MNSQELITNSLSNSPNDIMNQDVLNKLNERIIDLSIDYPDLEFLFTCEGHKCFSKGDIQIVKGKAKSGKSTFMLSLFAALLKGNYMGFNASIPEFVCMYIDTEQNQLNTAKITKSVHILSGLNLNERDPRFIAINLRGDNPNKRREYIEAAIYKFKPGLIIIDGIKDLIIGGDINDAKACHEAVEFLMFITKTYNLVIITTLHENKNDQHLRGHIGTELLNKSSEVWQVSKKGEVFEVEQTENRNEHSGNIRFSFIFDDLGLPVLVESTPKIDRTVELQLKKIESFSHCLADGGSKSYTQLAQEYCEVHNVKIKTAENDISIFRKSGYLIKDPTSGLYRFNCEKMPN